MINDLPSKTRLTTKYRRDKSVFTMKIFNGVECYQVKVTTEAGFRIAQKTISAIMHLMSSPELLSK